MTRLLLICLVLAFTATAEEWVVQLNKDVDATAFAQQHGLIYKGPVSFMEPSDNYHIFTAADGSNRKRTEEALRSDTQQVKWAEVQQKRQKQYTRIADPLYESQWHLHTHPFSVDADHASGRTGLGVTIAIVDDGLEHTHPDIAANYDAPHSWDFNGNDADPRPENIHDGHGTSAAGVAAAVKENGHCGRGVAPKAKIVGLRTIADSVTDLVEGQALSHNGIGVVDIYSCSWGPADDGSTMIEPGPLAEEALALYAGQQRGRFGKGSIYVWASGNGRDAGDTCAFDGYASSIYVNAIGAINHEGNISWYSEGCASLMAVTPSSGMMKGITTVDLMGSAGYDPSECTASFGGTSAAAPMAAGILALVLEERPELTWRDVKHVIAKGSIPVQVNDPDWHMNAAGYKHSHKYGFGLMKVPSMLEAARTHQLVPPMKFVGTNTILLSTLATMIPCNHTHEVKGVTDIHFIEHVKLMVGLSHERRGNVKISLISPSGTVSVLAEERPRDHHANYALQGWTFTSVRHWGESKVNGNWTFVFEDNNNKTKNRGHFNGFKLGIYGY